jgi:GR25 family glycosyltransferase involved in LPS biosynthesis
MTDPCAAANSTQDEAGWYALLQHSRRLRESGNEKEFVKTALHAFRRRPHRAEPLHDLAHYYFGKSRGDIAVIYADAGLSLPVPKTDQLGVEPAVYDTGLKEMFTIAASYSKDPEEKERGRAICNWLSLSRDVPDRVRALARLNYHWYSEPASAIMPSIQFHPIAIDALGGFKPGNISIAREREGFVALIRAVNYDLLESGYFDRHGDTSFRQRIFLAQLDENLQITKSAEAFPPEDLPPPQHIDSVGFEDPRPIMWRGDLWCISCVRQLNSDGRAEMVLARIAQTPQCKSLLTDWRVLASGMPAQWEKNWMPQVIGHELRFIYSLDPTRLLSESGDVLLQETPSIAVESLRGGSQAIPFDGGWLMVVHEWQVLRTRRHYFHRFVWLDQNNRLSRISRRFFFQRIASEFAAGLAWHVTGDRLVVSFGIDDHEPTLAVVEANDIRAALLDIDEHRRASEQACEAGRLAWEALALPECSMVVAGRKREGSDPVKLTTKVGPDMIGDIHLINLDLSVDRLRKFHARNSDLDGVFRVSAVDGSEVDKQKLIADGVITDDLPYLPGSLGCSLSHIGLWQKAVSRNEITTVFEDDAVCVHRFREKANEILSKLPHNWDIILWGFDHAPKFLWVDLGFSKAKLEFYSTKWSGGGVEFQICEFSSIPVRIVHSFGTYGYSISPKGARSLLEFCLPLKKRFIPFPETGVVIEDICIDCTMCGIYPSMQAFACIPPLVLHDVKQISDRIARDECTMSPLPAKGEQASVLDQLNLEYDFQDLKEKGFSHSTDLCQLMTSFGSDKGSSLHNYTVVYDWLFSRFRNEELALFELGLGTNKVGAPSSMGPEGKPGASLRAWRAYFSRARIYGADIDRDILFEEDRIRTFWTDQRDPRAIRALWDELEDVSFDIMVDDGLHEGLANICFFMESFGKLKPGGIFAIEDVQSRDAELMAHFARSIAGDCKHVVFEELDHPRNKVDNRLLILQKA